MVRECNSGEPESNEKDDAVQSPPPRGVIAFIKTFRPGQAYHRISRFDLTRLNWIGWLLLIASFGVALGLVFLVAYFFERPVLKLPIFRSVLVFVLLWLPIGFFFGVRWLLGKVGITIYEQ